MSKLSYYRTIRILQVEGNDRHAERVRMGLYAAGLNCSIRRVTSREAYVAALREFWPDIVVAGSDVPGLPMAEALDLAHRNWRFLPVVFAEQDDPAGIARLHRTIVEAILLAREIRGRRIADMGAHHAPLLAARIKAERTKELVPFAPMVERALPA
jgi:AmiR/NasT family two-component response regulator